MAIKFDKKYVDVARKEFYMVLVDKETPEQYIGSLTGYAGDRIRIYASEWHYDEPVIFRSNAAFKKWLKEELDAGYDGIEFLKPALI